MSDYPLATLACSISDTGITAPTFNDIFLSLQASYRSIFGSDVVLTQDTQDGQWLAVIASAIDDCNQSAIAVYNSFSPSTAQGAGLSSVVKINGIRRQSASNSTVIVECIGVAGTIIEGAVVKDSNGYLWDVPYSVIPSSGTITVTATAQMPGAITASAGAVTISTPTAGWQSAAFTASASEGAAVESDAALRSRQAISTALPSLTTLYSILGNVANVAGVSRYKVYNNDTGSADSEGIPAHSIAAVVEGGDSTAIATAIERSKAPGVGTYGTTAVTVVDPAGLPITINYFVLTEVQIHVAITIKALPGYVSSTGTKLQQDVVDFINSLDVGEDVYLSWLYGPAGLSGDALSLSFKVNSIQIGLSAETLGTSDLTIAFNQAAQCLLANVTLTVV